MARNHRLLWLLLLSCLGCRPITTGDRAANPLLGEWQVERTEGASGGTHGFFILEVTADAARVFRSGEYREGTYELAADQLTLRIKGYPPERYTILRRDGGFDLRHDATQTTYFLANHHRFDAMSFFGALALGVVGLVILLMQAESLRVYLCSGAWPEVPADVVAARVVTDVTERHKQHATYEDEIAGEVVRGGPLGDTVRIKSYAPEVRFRYDANGERRDGSNAAGYNRKASYTAAEAAAVVEQWRRDGLRVRYDPRDPSVVFLGREHFPLLTTLLLWAVGSFLVLGLAGAFSTLAGAAGYEVIKLGTVDWTVLPLVAALPVYLLGVRALS